MAARAEGGGQEETPARAQRGGGATVQQGHAEKQNVRVNMWCSMWV